MRFVLTHFGHLSRFYRYFIEVSRYQIVLSLSVYPKFSLTATFTCEKPSLTKGKRSTQALHTYRGRKYNLKSDSVYDVNHPDSATRPRGVSVCLVSILPSN